MTLKPPDGSNVATTSQNHESRLNSLEAIIVDATRSTGIYTGMSTSGTAASNAAVLNAHLANGHNVFIPGNSTGTAYDIAEVTFPVSSHGGATLFGEGMTRTRLNYTGSSHAITFGDGGATDTRYQSVQHLELSGNANALSGVRFNTTRWCSVRYCDLRGFTNASAHAVLIEGSTAARANYFNEIEGCQFGQSTNRSHIKLLGNADGTGANSNYIFRCHFSLATDQAILIDGGDTNRIHHCEFTDATPVGVSFANSAALFNRVESCHFDSAVVKAWSIAGSSVSDTQLMWNTGSTPIGASTDSGTRTSRVDPHSGVSFPHGGGSVTFTDVTVGRGSGAWLQTSQQFRAVGGVTTMVKAGIPTDADTTLDADGTLIVDTTNNHLYFRSGGTFRRLVPA